MQKRGEIYQKNIQTHEEKSNLQCNDNKRDETKRQSKVHKTHHKWRVLFLCCFFLPNEKKNYHRKVHTCNHDLNFIICSINKITYTHCLFFYSTQFTIIICVMQFLDTFTLIVTVS